MYSEGDCFELIKKIHNGNISTGGIKFVTMCYDIVGFVKFLGPYYMILITKRKKIGVIYGHSIYSITRSHMISIPNSTVQSNMAYSESENRYKKLLCTVDLTKDFFFSYSYRVMHSLQKNMSGHEAGQVLYETMFVWNEFMTRGIQKHLKNTLRTVALVYGCFQQKLNQHRPNNITSTSEPGCLLTIGLQVLASTVPNAKLNLSSVTAINNHICNTIHQINTALTGSSTSGFHDSSGLICGKSSVESPSGMQKKETGSTSRES